LHFITETNFKLFQEATQYVSNMYACLGGTDLINPLRKLIQMKNSRSTSGPVKCFILTDGQVENNTNVIQFIEQYHHLIQVFSVGIGNDVDMSLVRGIANAAHGTSTFVQEADKLHVINFIHFFNIPF
jgi:uncharacterized protein with von Willebrand factor type A (vWA) domain